MPNPSPHHARMAKKRRGKPGDLPAVKRELWHALQRAVQVLDGAPEANPELILKAVHAVSQVCGQYMKLLEIGELESRFAALEALVKRGGDASVAATP